MAEQTDAGSERTLGRIEGKVDSILDWLARNEKREETLYQGVMMQWLGHVVLLEIDLYLAVHNKPPSPSLTVVQ